MLSLLVDFFVCVLIVVKAMFDLMVIDQFAVEADCSITVYWEFNCFAGFRTKKLVSESLLVFRLSLDSVSRAFDWIALNNLIISETL